MARCAVLGTHVVCREIKARMYVFKYAMLDFPHMLLLSLSSLIVFCVYENPSSRRAAAGRFCFPLKAGHHQRLRLPPSRLHLNGLLPASSLRRRPRRLPPACAGKGLGACRSMERGREEDYASDCKTERTHRVFNLSPRNTSLGLRQSAAAGPAARTPCLPRHAAAALHAPCRRAGCRPQRRGDALQRPEAGVWDRTHCCPEPLRTSSGLEEPRAQLRSSCRCRVRGASSLWSGSLA